MIAARDGEAVAVHRARNAAASPLRYEIDGHGAVPIQTAIEDAGLELGAIYHSHTRSAPLPSQTDINLAFYPEALYVIVGRRRTATRPTCAPGRSWTGRSPRPSWRSVDDRRALVSPLSARPARRGTTTASGSARAAACRSCLPARPGPGGPRARAARARAQGPPAVRRGPARARSAARATRPRPSCSQGMLLEEGIPSLMRRSGGFDVPDFLAAGPRDILVPASGAERRARDPAAARRRRPCPSAARARAAAVGARAGRGARRAGHRARRRRRVRGDRLGAPPRRRRSHPPSGRGASARRPRCGGRRGRGSRRAISRSAPPRARRDRRALALLARQQVEHGAAEQQRVGGLRAGTRARRPRAAAGRSPAARGASGPSSHCAAPSTSHAAAHPAAQPQRAERRREARVAGGRARAGRAARAGASISISSEPSTFEARCGQQPRGEHVQLALARPADDVAPRRRRGQPPLQRRSRAARRRAAPASRGARPRARRARPSSWRSSRSRPYSSCASTRSASLASRSSWRATKVSDAVSAQATRPFWLATRRSGSCSPRPNTQRPRPWISSTCW